MIIFHHIKRTGGTFLHKEFEKRFNWILFYDKITQNYKVNPKTQMFEFVSSHDLFKDIITHRESFYFTVYRYPIDIIRSWIRLRISLDQVNGHHKDGIEFSRRVIDGIIDERHVELPYINRIAEEVVTPGYWEKYLMIDPSKYDFIGLTEFMPTTLDLLNRRLHIDIINTRVNSSDGRIRLIDKDYRRYELVDRLEDHINMWHSIRANLIKNANLR